MRAIGLLAMAALFCSAGWVLAQDVEADFGMDVKELAQAQKDSDEKGIGATVSELARARGEAASNRADAAATVAQAHSIREAVATARAGLGKDRCCGGAAWALIAAYNPCRLSVASSGSSWAG